MRAIVFNTILCCVVAGWFSSAAAQGAPKSSTNKPSAKAPNEPVVSSPDKTGQRPDKGDAQVGVKAAAAAPAAEVKAETDASVQAEPAAGEQKAPGEVDAGASTATAAPPPPPPPSPDTGAPKAAQEAPPSLLPSFEPIPPEAKGTAAAEVPTPGEAGDRLARAIPESVKAQEQWTAPQPVVTLHGYYRMRGELEDSFWLGRAVLPTNPSDQGYDPHRGDPFTAFKPLERLAKLPAGACGDESQKDDGRCDISTLQFANMRLRLAPQLNISDDVRVKMVFDLFDDMIAGTGPVSYFGRTSSETAGTTGIFVSGDEPSGQTIAVRQAWGEVRRRGLGELRFGRMPNHWGLGILNNAGTEIDNDFSSSIDRVMGITKIAGLYLTAAYDFIAEGVWKPNDATGLPTDASQLDDVDQFTFTVARRLAPEEQEAILESGGVALNGGGYFSYRVQDMTSNETSVPSETPGEPPTTVYDLYHIGAESFTFDAWGQLRWRSMRLELEAALIAGTIDNTELSAVNRENYKILSFGSALEFEYRFINDKLGIHFDTGLATGDSDVEGLSSVDDLVYQRHGANAVTTFRFNPAYRIDMVLWRSIMRQVTGAYYFKPGINYDFIRSPYGQLFGGRVNIIWSRAACKRQTWGDGNDLGVEFNTSVYWRSEDGPEPIDGFHAIFQWGMLFPLQGLGYTKADKPAGFKANYPQNLRLVLGVVF